MELTEEKRELLIDKWGIERFEKQLADTNKNRNGETLTVLSFGGGQDSTAILYKILYDEEFKRKYVAGDLIVIMAETGNEHDETYKHVEYINGLCLQHGIPFYFLNDYTYTPNTWKGGLVSFYESKNTCGGVSMHKTCTDNLKIKPIYKFLDEYVHTMYGTSSYGSKKAIKEFAEKYGKINVIIGIASKEEKRASLNLESPQVWFRLAINKVYPLLPEKMDRKACQEYIASVGHEVPLPSNCIICPFLSKAEMIYLYRMNRKWWDKLVQLEKNKIEYWAESQKEKGMANNGVLGAILLPEAIKKFIITPIEKTKPDGRKWGDLSDDELLEYKMSHGHCVTSKY